MEGAEVSFVMFGFSFVSMIVFAEGKRGCAWKKMDMCRDR